MIVIVGDTLLDRDVDGAVTRVSPDAPVPVLAEQSTLDRPGGAGLAALLAARRGEYVALVTGLADDAAGARLSALLSDAGVRLYPLRMTGTTPEKIRLRSRGQALLRLDRGDAEVAGEPNAAALMAIAEADAILVSDYGRGLARQPALRAALAETTAPVVWDPHPRGPAPVRGVRLATPNEAEVRHLTGDSAGGHRVATAARGGQELRQRWRTGAVAVTMGGDGALLCHGPTPLVVPTPARVGGDTCGAGDRFAATAALALAGGALVSEAVQAAVREATAYVASGGVHAALAPEVPAVNAAGVGREAAGELVGRVRARGGRVVATGGCFDLLHAGHIATLEAARRLGDCLVVCLNSDSSVTSLKGPERPMVRQDDRARLLAALSAVDAVVVFEESTPDAVLSWLRPDVWVKGGDYGSDGGLLPEADLVQRWGGECVIVPYLDGRSTTRMIAAARHLEGV
ncbi:PfkB family carbohydrate kinase [Phytohabitans sp. ZYX-F-186]|uniref:PfkB family carbohydrate kinase n=1 Tax=Phytohabitans maris TaxID=3071409 RepID=A0ABU0ZD15_9ACTN|nr:PfkB family carbohydrate kinase [Phytohabitans sp. ZYX-F-186]MDQ7904205.1 PfkB family carbohydrate kinase [Phytohabitans sp. ZYX-F-186]